MNTVARRTGSSLVARRWLGRAATLGRSVEHGLAVTALLAMGVLPVLELLLRAVLGMGIPGAAVDM